MNATYTTENDSYYGTLLHLKRATGESRFPLYDEIGSARGLVDASATVTDTYDMDTFGRPVASTGSTPNPYRYGAAWGYMSDPSGFLQLGARYYWPEVGRFVQQDPAREDTNWYAYADGNPVLKGDPAGRGAIACAKRKLRSAARRIQNTGRALMSRVSNTASRFSGEADGDKMQHCYVACRMARAGFRATVYYGQRLWELAGPGPESDEDTRAADVGAFECGSDKKPGGCPRGRGKSNAQHCEDCCRGKVRDHQY